MATSPTRECKQQGMRCAKLWHAGGVHLIRSARLHVCRYHNSTHVAHVLHRVHMLLHVGFVPGYVPDPLTKLAVYLAAAVHDYEV